NLDWRAQLVSEPQRSAAVQLSQWKSRQARIHNHWSVNRAGAGRPKFQRLCPAAATFGLALTSAGRQRIRASACVFANDARTAQRMALYRGVNFVPGHSGPQRLRFEVGGDHGEY